VIDFVKDLFSLKLWLDTQDRATVELEDELSCI